MLVSEKHRQLILNLKNPDRVLGLVPAGRLLDYKGHTLTIVPHTIEVTRILRNLGMDTPAPMGRYYDWPGRYPPYVHQRVTAEFLSMNERAFCLNGLGSGKTLSVLWAFHYLRSLGLVTRMLVCSPLSTLERAWGDEIFRNFPDLSFAVLHGTRSRRMKLLNADHDVYIINHDGVKTDGMVDALVHRADIDLVVVDELASFRNSSTERWKAMNTIINGENTKKRQLPRKAWAWGLTGPPTPNAPTDAYAQVKLIRPGAVANVYFGAFRDTVMRQHGPFKWIARESANDTVARLMQPAVRFSREECIDLPPTTIITRHAPLTADQESAFKQMQTNLKAEIDGQQLTAINEAVKISKLLQISLGVAYGPNGEEITLPNNPRVEVVKELIEEAEGKALVFVPLTSALEHLAEALRDTYGQDAVAVVQGSTPRAERDAIFQAFQVPGSRLRVIVANPGTLSHGLTLTEASLIVWYGPTNSNETYEQANARITRPGQRRNTLIARIESTWLEREVYTRLAERQGMQGILLSMMKEPR